MVTVPPLPLPDPLQSIMAEPRVPDHKRFCPNPACADAAGNPTPLTRREAGFCPQCGARYSFVPTLQAGDIVAEQYEVKGCLAFGGLGWIYLAKDTTLNRWVVLKGLLNTADEAAAEAAVAQRQFLAAVKHANIVGIYNFVKKGTEGFIVMEYVGGATVKDLRKKRGPLPVAEGIAYVHRILGAFAYLHRQGMVYCDMKPDNFMVEGDPPDVKLIDMGGVRLLDDPRGDIYGTRGYSAPEAAEGPTVVSDLYTLGRTLAVLVMDFKFQSAHQFTLPAPAEQPVLAQHESLHRFLLKATAQDPARRFQSADEMADQLGGILREVAAADGEPRPAESTLFTGDLATLADEDGVAVPGADQLPGLKVDPEDPAANFILSLAAVGDPTRRTMLLKQALPRFRDSAELLFRLTRELIVLRDFEEADVQLVKLEGRGQADWRLTWHRGLLLLAQGQADKAQRVFDEVYSELPGELAPKLAVAVAAEVAGEWPTAGRLYDLVCRTDPTFTTAAFGLARVLVRSGQRPQAVEALGRVPATSSLYVHAQVEVARTLMHTTPAPSIDEVHQAARVIEALTLEGLDLARLKVEVLENAVTLLGGPKLVADPALRLLGQPLQETALRRALEAALRQRARLEKDSGLQVALIDRANAMRPRTWL